MMSVMRPGPRRHHDDPVRQVDRLGDRVRDEHDGGLGGGTDPQQFGLHVLTGHLVERAERFVHQQQRRMRGERPGDGDTLLHPAGQLPRACARRSPAAGRVRASPRRACRRLALSQPLSSSGSSMFLRDGAPVEQARLLERHAVVLVETGLAAGLPLTSTCPPSARSGWRSAAAASTCRSPTARSATRTRPAATTRSMSTSASTWFGRPALKTIDTRSTMPPPTSTRRGDVRRMGRRRVTSASAVGCAWRRDRCATMNPNIDEAEQAAPNTAVYTCAGSLGGLLAVGERGGRRRRGRRRDLRHDHPDHRCRSRPVSAPGTIDGIAAGKRSCTACCHQPAA